MCERFLEVYADAARWSAKERVWLSAFVFINTLDHLLSFSSVRTAFASTLSLSLPMKTFVWISLLLAMWIAVEARKHRRANEIRIINSSERNLKLHCQSNLTDLRDQFVYHEEDFQFNFYDFDPGNHHFWCDAYGLEEFFETFDIFGKAAPMDGNQTWYLQPDGLYFNSIQSEARRMAWWTVTSK